MGGVWASASDMANIVGAKRPNAVPSSENESTFRRDSFLFMSNFLTSAVAHIEPVTLVARLRRREQARTWGESL